MHAECIFEPISTIISYHSSTQISVKFKNLCQLILIQAIQKRLRVRNSATVLAGPRIAIPVYRGQGRIPAWYIGGYCDWDCGCDHQGSVGTFLRQTNSIMQQPKTTKKNWCLTTTKTLKNPWSEWFISHNFNQWCRWWPWKVWSLTLFLLTMMLMRIGNLQ